MGAVVETDETADATVRFDHTLLEDPAATLAQLGGLPDDVTQQSPDILLLRGWCRSLARLPGLAWDDFQQADELDCDDVRVRGLIDVHWARCRALIDGDVDDGMERLTMVLEDTPAEVHDVVAYALYVKGQLVALREGRHSLVLAERLTRWSLREWEQVPGAATSIRLTRLALAASILEPLGRYRDLLVETNALLSDPGLGAVHRSFCLNLRAVASLRLGHHDAAIDDLDTAARLAFDPMIPARIAEVAWIKVLAAAVAGDTAMMTRQAAKAERALAAADTAVSVPFLTDMALEFGALGELDVAQRYLERARELDALDAVVNGVDAIHRMRRGEDVDLSSDLASMAPARQQRALIVAAAAAARRGDRSEASALMAAATEAMCESGVPSPTAAGEGLAYRTVAASLGDVGLEPLSDLGRRVDVLQSPVTVRDTRGTAHPVASGRSRELLAVIAAYGGTVGVDTAARAMYPGKPRELASGSLRVALHRLTRETGLSLRTERGLAFPDDVACDLLELTEICDRATGLLRQDPDAAAPLALEVIATVEQGVLLEFDTPWADVVRRKFDRHSERLASLLAARALDAGDSGQAASWTSARGAA